MEQSARTAAASRRPVFVVVGAMTFILSACGGASATPSAASSDACDFDGSTETVEQEGPGTSLELSAVRHEIVVPGCEESVAFVFDSLPDGAEPGYRVFYRDTPFEAPNGEVEVEGDALLEVVLIETSASDDMTPPEPATNSALVGDLVQPPEVPGGSLWLIGVDEERPFTVAVGEAPDPALVVTIGAAASP